MSAGLRVNSGHQTFNGHRGLLKHNATRANLRTTFPPLKSQVPTNNLPLLVVFCRGESLRIFRGMGQLLPHDTPRHHPLLEVTGKTKIKTTVQLHSIQFFNMTHFKQQISQNSIDINRSPSSKKPLVIHSRRIKLNWRLIKYGVKFLIEFFIALKLTFIWPYG